jgi:hypothetical protein
MNDNNPKNDKSYPNSVVIPLFVVTNPICIYYYLLFEGFVLIRNIQEVFDNNNKFYITESMINDWGDDDYDYNFV